MKSAHVACVALALLAAGVAPAASLAPAPLPGKMSMETFFARFNATAKELESENHLQREECFKHHPACVFRFGWVSVVLTAPDPKTAPIEKLTMNCDRRYVTDWAFALVISMKLLEPAASEDERNRLIEKMLAGLNASEKGEVESKTVRYTIAGKPVGPEIEITARAR